MAGGDPQKAAEIQKAFKECQAIYRSNYPSSPIDFDAIDLTKRLTKSRWNVGFGKYSDVYQGLLDHNKKVAVKVLRTLPVGAVANEECKTTIKRFLREVNIWYGLNHTNIAQLHGYTLGNGVIGLVSHWYSNGNVVDFLKSRPGASKPSLLLDVAEGLKFLHTCYQPLIHADLKGVNIFVNEYGVACIGDFGISKRIEDLDRPTGLTTSTTCGTIMWMAPELLSGNSLSTACDVYSFGGVLLEIYCSGKAPYYYLPSESLVIIDKYKGKLPGRVHYPGLQGQDALWNLALSCMSHDAQERPSISEIASMLYEEFGLAPRAHSSTSRRRKLSQVERYNNNPNSSSSHVTRQGSQSRMRSNSVSQRNYAGNEEEPPPLPSRHQRAQGESIPRPPRDSMSAPSPSRSRNASMRSSKFPAPPPDPPPTREGGSTTRPSSSATKHSNAQYTKSQREPSVRARRDSTATRNTRKTRTRSTHGKSQKPRHELMARVLVLWDWDGTIPNRRTKGPYIRRGDQLDVCSVVDGAWYQVHHQDACKYIPRSLVNVIGVYHERFRSQFRVADRDPQIVDNQTPYNPPEPPYRGFFASLCCLNILTRPYNQRDRPPIPPPPFEKEAYVVNYNGSHVQITTTCKQSPREMALMFKMQMWPAAGSRFTKLRFDALLPDGCAIAGISPEKYNCMGVETLEYNRQSQHKRKSSASSSTRSKRTRTMVSQDTESTKFTKGIAPGRGIDTNHATWVAAEELGSMSGLPDSYDFKLILRGNSFPSIIRYMFTLETEPSTGANEILEKAPTSNQWKSEWVEEGLP